MQHAVLIAPAPETRAGDMTIARLARGAGVGVETVRYYQRRGLMRLPSKGLDGAYRHYGTEDLHRLRFIRRAQAAGFTLKDIEALLALDPQAQRARIRQLATDRLSALEHQRQEIEASRAALGGLLSTCTSTAGGPCPIILALDEQA